MAKAVSSFASPTRTKPSLKRLRPDILNFMKAKALIVDDEPDIRELLEITLARMGLETQSAADLNSAQTALKQGKFDLCLTDMKLPDGNGISLVEHIQQHYDQLPVAVITAFGSMDLAIAALKAGAFDFVSKPIDLDNLRQLVKAALNLEASKPANPGANDLLGNSSSMQQLKQQITRLARSQAPVHIHGESGSGKELVARSIHQQSSRHGGPFIAVNCGAIPRELMESEFFGHKKGSFTGAIADKQGLFQAAQHGTVFLDEVAELPLDMQVKLLRAIQEKRVKPVGAEKEIPFDARILSATHQNLQQAVAEGSFRQDLFYRINVIGIQVPALRERPEDIPLLCEHFLSVLNREQNSTIHLTQAALQALQHYTFPGNVRELENLLERAATLCDQQSIDVDDLHLPHKHINTPQKTVATPQPKTTPAGEHRNTHTTFHPHPVYPVFENLDQYINDIERSILEQALSENRWNKTATAQYLGITFRQLRYKLKKLNMD